MSTATEPTPNRLRLDAVSWGGYVAISDALGERPIRCTYDRGTLEVMTLSAEHELMKKVLGMMIDVLIEEYELPFEALGSTTFRREDLERGLEPDECYYFEHAAAVRGKSEIDLNVDPAPDLAVEVDVSTSSLDRIAMLATLGVAEVWRHDGENVAFLRLRARARYVRTPHSVHFPGLSSADATRFAHQALAMEKSAWRRAFRAWVRENLRP